MRWSAGRFAKHLPSRQVYQIKIGSQSITVIVEQGSEQLILSEVAELAER